MAKIRFDPTEKGGLELAREIALQRLKEDKQWNQHSGVGQAFDRYVEYIGDADAGRRRLASLVQDILWEFMIQGVLAPGLDIGNPNLPFFHVTEYGSKVISEGRYLPHDPTGYLDRFQQEVTNPDPVVITYLSESLECFSRGNLIASVVMLGIASERMFILLCSALLDSLSDSNEKAQFQRILDSNPMKPKMDWASNKIEALQQHRPRPLPDDVTIMLTGIFNFIRCQRNELGHPQDTPPNITREDAFVYLRLFPRYCKTVTQIIGYLQANKV